MTGRVGGELTVEQGQEAARLTTLSILASLKAELGDLDRVTSWVKALGLVQCAPGFDKPPAVINGFTDLVLDLWGDPGRPPRALGDRRRAAAVRRPGRDRGDRRDRVKSAVSSARARSVWDYPRPPRVEPVGRRVRDRARRRDDRGLRARPAGARDREPADHLHPRRRRPHRSAARGARRAHALRVEGPRSLLRPRGRRRPLCGGRLALPASRTRRTPSCATTSPSTPAASMPPTSTTSASARRAAASTAAGSRTRSRARSRASRGPRAGRLGARRSALEQGWIGSAATASGEPTVLGEHPRDVRVTGTRSRAAHELGEPR